MNYIQTEIDGVWLIEPKVLRDERGYFMEAFKEEEFKMHIGDVHFIQDNESKSSFGVLRGLHYQKGERSQSKLVRVIKGKVLDVAVDLRQSSPTFGKYVASRKDGAVLSLGDSNSCSSAIGQFIPMVSSLKRMDASACGA